MGERVAVTGATGGIGYFVAEQLAGLGHPVVLLARSPAKAAAATASIRRLVPDAELDVVPLDLADLTSVARAADRLAGGRPLAALVADAAVVSYGLVPSRPRLSTDGLEVHLATAHLGHYALLARLLPRLQEWGARAVHVGSLSHRMPLGRDPWGRLTRPRREPSFVGYARSKVAVALFALELAARLAAAGSAASSVLAHPGTAVDVLTPVRDGIPASQPTDLGPVGRVLVRGMHGKDGGAAVLVRAAVDPSVGNGQVWGPAGRWQLAGAPERVGAPRPRRPGLTAELLRVSEELTGLPLGLSPVPPGRPRTPRRSGR
ncbi:SDR family NAD(P)-dependent oxidoreductase [Ornithinimicrobium avium]|uniref:SDR family NAD(P)-dependent oxidoreductase n=1 Tax=Ornithinimicrobium avium TaxID=2283195 RepID=A0A345NL09_9MICO|nr:SDR family NAD(P)-dependent oxidoreductase [Ornithinimicrobium avium]AXH95717.1 SDR family NAD(P)-dependent oxidoreductase [Ornithinimicrobium avium]